MFYSQPCTVAVHVFTLQAGYIMSCQDLCLWLRDSSSDSMVTVNSSAECNRREKYLQSKSYLLSRGGKERLFSELLWKTMRLTVKSVFLYIGQAFFSSFPFPLFLSLLSSILPPQHSHSHSHSHIHIHLPFFFQMSSAGFPLTVLYRWFLVCPHLS